MSRLDLEAADVIAAVEDFLGGADNYPDDSPDDNPDDYPDEKPVIKNMIVPLEMLVEGSFAIGVNSAMEKLAKHFPPDYFTKCYFETAFWQGLIANISEVVAARLGSHKGDRITFYPKRLGQRFDYNGNSTVCTMQLVKENLGRVAAYNPEYILVADIPMSQGPYSMYIAKYDSKLKVFNWVLSTPSAKDPRGYSTFLGSDTSLIQGTLAQSRIHDICNQLLPLYGPGGNALPELSFA